MFRKPRPPVQVAVSAETVTVTIDKALLMRLSADPSVYEGTNHGDWGGAEYPEFALSESDAGPLLQMVAGMFRSGRSGL